MRSNFLFVSALLLNITFAAAPVMAQNLVVTGNLMVIAHNDATPFAPDATLFPQASPSSSSSAVFKLFNASASNNVNITTVTISGANAGEFKLMSVGNPILPQADTDLYLQFQPASTGGKVAQVNIVSNDVSHPTFSFAISGESVDSLGDRPDISAAEAFVKEPTVKGNSKGEYTLKWKFDLSNGGAASEGAIAVIYATKFINRVDQTVPGNYKLLGSAAIKPIKAGSDGKIAHRKVKVKITGMDSAITEFPYVAAIVISSDPTEVTYYNNNHAGIIDFLN